MRMKFPIRDKLAAGECVVTFFCQAWSGQLAFDDDCGSLPCVPNFPICEEVPCGLFVGPWAVRFLRSRLQRSRTDRRFRGALKGRMACLFEGHLSRLKIRSRKSRLAFCPTRMDTTK